MQARQQEGNERADACLFVQKQAGLFHKSAFSL
jgi:hypothetical protein